MFRLIKALNALVEAFGGFFAARAFRSRRLSFILSFVHGPA